ncbi:microtubule-associated protein Jupiter isoform X4 [Monomorium pharaonis]|uniref:microtubule-associated protein Jupiter isoform X4 n=1 Tax=Monomorium pharaonis TaxID=307658 RepID=UPI0017463F70|nr:microtubule-associated protein Jupiter isoform X4 [Monomorium pharaonis]
MATYATYRHVELDNVGYGKKRVLKPPGGGSSDIFGAAPEETSPRRIKAHNQSQLGSALFGDTTDNVNAAVSPRNNKPGNDSYNRLFGPPDVPPTTPNARNHMRSNIPLSGGSSISSLSSLTSPAKSTASNSTSGIANGYLSNGSNSSNDLTDGNPVTGIGYASEVQKNGSVMQNGTASSNSSSNGEKSNNTSPVTVKPPMRNRVPPGGYSSGLW